MNAPLLLPPLRTPSRQLARLLGKLALQSDAAKYTTWCIYRLIRRQVRTLALLSSVDGMAGMLVERVKQGTSYATIALGLKLAQAYTIAQLRHAGGTARVVRALFIEAFHLVRLKMRVSLGMRPEDRPPQLQFGKPTQSVWHAFSDGSRRLSGAGVGIAIYEPSGGLHTEISVLSTATSALATELEAASLCLDTLLALKVRHAVLHIDSLGVFRAFQQRLLSKYQQEQARLLHSVLQFQSFDVILIPRMHNHTADRLAASRGERAV